MTTVKLLNVPFESNYKDTVWFPRSENNQFNIQAQTDYMLAREVRSFSDFSYQRKDNIIRVPAHIDTLYNCNYVMYKNSSNPNKWFYAFIIDMKYVNDERTDITIQTDVMQTWWFDYNVKPSFVEREHVDDDTIGLHTVPEQLETGEYVCDKKIDKQSLLQEMVIVVGSTIDLSKYKEATAWLSGAGDFPAVAGVKNYGVYSGVKYYAFQSDTTLTKILKDVAKEGQSDGIVSIFMAPIDFVNPSLPGDGTDVQIPQKEDGAIVEDTWYHVTRHTYNGEYITDKLPIKPKSLNGYQPNNAKLLTYPYCYMMASNNGGNANIYHYELFADNEDKTCDFRISGVVCPGMSIRLLPKNYGGVDVNNNEGLTLGKYPICSWNSDVYTNWLTQNSVNLGADALSGFATIAIGAGMLAGPVGTGLGVGFSTSIAGLSTVAGGSAQVAGTIGQMYQHSLIPPAIQGNLNAGDVTFSDNKLTFTLYQMSIKREYAQIIDNYFDMFGYKVNRVKVPNENHRFSYWYTKTIDVNIDGAIPNKDLEQIKQNYNNGITFWEHSANMGDYSQDNHIYKGI